MTNLSTHNIVAIITLIDLAKASEPGEINTQLVQQFNMLRQDLGLANLILALVNTAGLATNLEACSTQQQ